MTFVGFAASIFSYRLVVARRRWPDMKVGGGRALRHQMASRLWAGVALGEKMVALVGPVTSFGIPHRIIEDGRLAGRITHAGLTGETCRHCVG